MKKVDYEILAAAIKKQRENIYFSTGYTAPECAAILAHSEAIARTFAPDADAEGADTTTTAFVSTLLPRTLDYIVSKSPVTRSTNVPPVLAVQGPDYALFASFITSGADSSQHHIWAADSKTGGWTLVAKIKNNAGAGTYVPANMFVDKLNNSNVWLSFGFAQGGYVTPASQSGSSVLLKIAPRSTSVLNYAAS